MSTCDACLSGEGGNDLNGNKRQIKDQELKSGNQALLVNLALGLPVRLLRKNEGDSATGVLYYFDGLYDVVRPHESAVGAVAVLVGSILHQWQ